MFLWIHLRSKLRPIIYSNEYIDHLKDDERSRLAEVRAIMQSMTINSECMSIDKVLFHRKNLLFTEIEIQVCRNIFVQHFSSRLCVPFSFLAEVRSSTDELLSTLPTYLTLISTKKREGCPLIVSVWIDLFNGLAALYNERNLLFYLCRVCSLQLSWLNVKLIKRSLTFCYPESTSLDVSVHSDGDGPWHQNHSINDRRYNQAPSTVPDDNSNGRRQLN